MLLDAFRLNFERYVIFNLRIKSKCDFTQLDHKLFDLLPNGRTLLSQFHSLPNFLSGTYPLFRITHQDLAIYRNYWNSPASTLGYCEGVAQRSAHLRTHLDWLDIDADCLRALPAGGAVAVLGQVFPQFFWEKLSFFSAYGKTEGGYWERRISVDRLGVWMGMERDVGERLTTGALAECPGGASVMSKHGGSSYEVFRRAYPELNVRRRVWDWKRLGESFGLVKEVQEVYGIERKEDWYRTSIQQVARVHGKYVHKENVIALLKFWVPEEEWSEMRFGRRINKRAGQRYLGKKLREMFAEEVILEEHMFSDGGEIFYFDFYVPGLKMVVEYQGEQHYGNVIRWMDLEEQRARDEKKVALCCKYSFRLIHIPYWWNGSLPHLKLFFRQSQPSPHYSKN